MKIEEGKFYRTRGGMKAGPMRLAPLQTYPWRAEAPVHPRYATSWTDDGRFHTIHNDCTDYDLVAEWTDESTGPVITETVKRIKPGVYGRIVVGEHLTPGWIDIRWPVPGCTADELRAAAATLNEIADALGEAE